MTAGAFAALAARLPPRAGRAGVVALDDAGATLFAHEPDAVFAAASVMKIPLVMAVYADAALGRLSLDERLGPAPATPGSGVLRLLAGAGPLPVRDLAALTIAVSDNAAANLLLERLGPERVGARLAAWGLRRTRVERRLFDLVARDRGLDNVITAGETAALLLRLLRGECVDRTTSDAVLALLAECQDDSKLRRYLGGAVRVAHKSGWLSDACHDAGIVLGPRPVVVVGLTAGAAAGEGEMLLGLLGWCAARAAGNELPLLPPEAPPAA